MRVLTLALCLAAAVPAANTPEPTYYKDVLPVLQQNCQTCHRPGEAAPMSFLTYESTRPWAKAIKQAVSTRKMPPWGADPHVGNFSNDPTLSAQDLQTLIAWADTGAKPGNSADAPAAKQWSEGWQMGQPDAVFEMPVSHPVPASGTMEYTYFTIPTNFTEDRWVQMAEARPGNRAVVHHMIAFVKNPGSKWLTGIEPGKAFVPKGKRDSGGGGEDGRADEWIVGWAPGATPMALQPGQAILVKKGAEIVLQVHYTTNGTAAMDRSKVGLKFAQAPVTERVKISQSSTDKFAIPPGDPNYQVNASVTLAAPVRLINMWPHMHVRGKAFAMRAVYPDGRTEDLVRVPRYDFNWQHVYELPQAKALPAGTKIEATAWYDNSPNNPANPDPKATVKWGDQSWEEMMIGFFLIGFDPAMDPKNLYPPPPAKKTAPATSAAGAE